jgi:hypothetical protein
VDDTNNKSLAEVLKSTETKILDSSKDLKNIVIESGQMAESLFETVNDGYRELTVISKKKKSFKKQFLKFKKTFTGRNQRIIQC